jgi:nicotianamine synthase
MAAYNAEKNSESTKMSESISKYIAETTNTITPPRTPTGTTSSAHKLFAEVQDIHTTISRLPGLAPGAQVNELLTRLVGLCITPHSADFISDFFSIRGVPELCKSLRPLCGAAEGELENYWARSIIKEAEAQPTRTSLSHSNIVSSLLIPYPEDTKTLLASFPYHQNYIDLSNLEMSTLSTYLPPNTAPKNVAFIGSGPLPLTSLCMLDRYPAATVHNIDRDAAALSTSQTLCEKLGYDRMTFSCEDVTETSTSTTWEEFDVVFLAALVGCDTASKIGILASLSKKLKRGTLVVARSAKGLREVLYPVSSPCHYEGWK